MAVSIDFDICINNSCDTLTLTETTGAYSATNTGGWGSPNATTGSITTALLQVTSPSGGVYTINILSAGLPSSNPSFDYDIANSSLGNITSIEDGKWTFFLYYTDGTTIYQRVKNFFFYCNSECCVQQLLANIEIEDCNCCEQEQKDKIDNYIKAKTFLEALKNAARCNQESNFDSIQEILAKLCRNSNCNSCQ